MYAEIDEVSRELLGSPVSARLLGAGGPDLESLLKEDPTALQLVPVEPVTPPEPATSPAATSPAAPVEPAAAPGRAEVLANVVDLYATALEYPPEVLEEDTDLESELGVDSVKQTELLARVAYHFGMPPRPDGFRAADYSTLRRVVDLVLDHTGAVAR